MTHHYRQATLHDLAQLRELALVAYGTFEQDLTPDNWQLLHQKLDAEDSYRSLLAIARCFLCELDGRIIGVAYFVPSSNPTDIFEPTWSYLRMVGVHPDHQGKGIGVHLTRLCIDHAIQTHEQVIALHTSELMDAARYIYGKLGFRQIRELDPIFGKRYWLYQLDLATGEGAADANPIPHDQLP